MLLTRPHTIPWDRPLRAVSWTRFDRAPVGTVVALHGYGDTRGAFSLAGPAWADRGLSVLAYDQPGFGREPARWPGVEALVGALEAACSHATKVWPGRPVFLAGESMGGSVALLALARDLCPDVVGAVMAEPGVRGAVPARRTSLAMLSLLGTLVPWLSRPLDLREDRGLDDEARSRLDMDPDLHARVTLGQYAHLVRLAELATRAAPSVARPVLLQRGHGRGIVRGASVDGLTRSLGGASSCWVDPQAPHLLWQGRRWRKAVAEAADWMLAGLGVGRSVGFLNGQAVPRDAAATAAPPRLP